MESLEPVKFKYDEIMNFDMQNLCSKLAQTPTHNKNASHINHFLKQIKAARDKIVAEYNKQITEKFAVRDDAGKIVREKNDEHGFTPDPTRMEEFQAAQTGFGESEIEITWRPLNPKTLEDVKMTAKEIEMLKGMYTEQEGPGVPHLKSI